MKLLNLRGGDLLLPRRFRTAGYIFLIPGIVLAVIRFYFELKLDIFNTKVFAVYSSYLETKYFSVIDNHISEEIAGCLLLTGLLFTAFSREKIENEEINLLRLYLHTGFLIFPSSLSMELDSCRCWLLTSLPRWFFILPFLDTSYSEINRNN